MKNSLIPGGPRPSRWLSTVTAVLLVVFIEGCASPGPPRPPSLNLPETVKDLTAERVGDEVRLHWTIPEKTTDHLFVQGPMTADICRTTAPPSLACASIKRLPVRPGTTQAADTLPQFLTEGPAALLAYRVQIFNTKGRSSGPSPEAFAAAGVAPPAVAQLRAVPTRDGAMLEWQPSDNPAPVQLDRLPVGPDGVVVQPAPPKATSKSSTISTPKTHTDHPPKTTQSPEPKPPHATAPIEVKLQTPLSPTDQGGTIDHTAQMGQTYQYAAQRVRSLSIGGHTLELRSSMSLPVTVAKRNTFPPHAPVGLEAVPGGATAADRSIDLSWTPNTDPDLAGYSVYRQEINSTGVAAGTATRLNATPVVGPAYRDQTAVAGRRYAYHVTAVDSVGNESAPSADVYETLREQ